MARAQKKACANPGCPNVTLGARYCDPCEKERRRLYQQVRNDDNDFYRTARWRRFRAWLKRRLPLCRECKENGRLVPSKHFDHIQPRRERPDLAFETSNIDPHCESCHNSKSAKELHAQRKAARLP